MLIKAAQGRDRDIEELESLKGRLDATPATKEMIEKEIRNIRAGEKAERDSAYEMDFHFGPSKNWMVIHDLRLEHDGRSAQIDHVLINRFMEIFVLETKGFSEGVAVNERGEFSAFKGSKPYGIPSPVEQMERHIEVMRTMFRDRVVDTPTRLGLPINPSFKGYVLISAKSRLSLPKTLPKGFSLDLIIKNDQLSSRIFRDLDKDNNIFGMAKLVSSETLESFACALACNHRPIKFDWAAKFGLPKTPPAPKDAPKKTDSTVKGEAERKPPRRTCDSCGEGVSAAVERFCLDNGKRFGERVLCMPCQKKKG